MTLILLIVTGCDGLVNFPYEPLCQGITKRVHRAGSIDFEWLSDGNTLIVTDQYERVQRGTRYYLVDVEGKVEKLSIDNEFVSLPSQEKLFDIQGFEIVTLPTEQEGQFRSEYIGWSTLYSIDRESLSLKPIDVISESVAVASSEDQTTFLTIQLQDRFATQPKTVAVGKLNEPHQLNSLAEFEIGRLELIADWSQKSDLVLLDVGDKINLLDLQSGKAKEFGTQGYCYWEEQFMTSNLVVATSSKYRDFEPGGGGYDLVLWDTDNNEYQQLTDYVDQDEFQPNPSPNKNQVVFVQASTSESGELKQDLMLLDLENNSAIQLTDTPTLHEFRPLWSPDESKVAYLFEEGFGVKIAIMSIESRVSSIVYVGGQ